MADLASLLPKQSGFARALVARLEGGITQSMKTAAWVELTLPELKVEELGNHEASRSALENFDYLFLIAASSDAEEAEGWRAAARVAGVSRVIASLCEDEPANDRYGKDWAAVFVNRDGDPHIPLGLLFGPRFVGFSDGDLFGVLAGRTTFVSRLRVDQIGDAVEIGVKRGLASASAMIAHFNMTDPPVDKPDYVPDCLTLGEIDRLYEVLASQLPAKADDLLSVSTSAQPMDGDAVDVYVITHLS